MRIVVHCAETVCTGSVGMAQRLGSLLSGKVLVWSEVVEGAECGVGSGRSTGCIPGQGAEGDAELLAGILKARSAMHGA